MHPHGDRPGGKARLTDGRLALLMREAEEAYPADHLRQALRVLEKIGEEFAGLGAKKLGDDVGELAESALLRLDDLEGAQLSLEEQARRFLPAGARTLVLALLARPNRSLTRDELALALWGRKAVRWTHPKTLAARLRQALCRANAALSGLDDAWSLGAYQVRPSRWGSELLEMVHVYGL